MSLALRSARAQAFAAIAQQCLVREVHLKLPGKVLGVPYSSREPSLHQLLIGGPGGGQGLGKG